LFGDVTNAFGSGFDPVLCAAAGGSSPADKDKYPECDTQYFDVQSGPNKELEEETSTNVNLGIVWEPVEDLGVTLDWYNIEMKNVVDAPSYQDVINDPGKYPGTEVSRNPDGTIKSVYYGPVNQAFEKRSGLDLSASYAYDTDSLGSFSTRVAVTKILVSEYQENAGEDIIDETNYLPEYTASLNLGWQYDAYSVNLFGKYRDRMCSSYANQYYFDTCQDAKDAGYDAEIASLTTWNLTASYAFSDDARVTIGAINLFDATPPADPLNDTSPFYADGYDDPTGRTLYIEGSMNF